ncbi:hypothetical protein HY214_04250 [Candidatus Roizmanbacteria bacterium]|nr:hypothetical protein [Candidatus Roizmanbacteria bacterium]
MLRRFKQLKALLMSIPLLIVTAPVLAQGPSITIQVSENSLGFKIPTLSDILTFMIRAFFIVAGLAALLFLLLGALAWVTSGGNKENVQKAQEKIQAAIVGVIMIAVVLAVIATLEQVVFGGKICFGLSCPVTIPTLVKPL